MDMTTENEGRMFTEQEENQIESLFDLYEQSFAKAMAFRLVGRESCSRHHFRVAVDCRRQLLAIDDSQDMIDDLEYSRKMVVHYIRLERMPTHAAIN